MSEPLPRPQTGNPSLDGYVRRLEHERAQPVEAKKLSGTNLVTDAPMVTWAPFGATGFRIVEGLYRRRTTDGVVARLFEVEIPDGCVSMFKAFVTAASATLTGTSVELTITYKRTGATVTAIGAVAATNRVEDVAGWDATLTVSGTNLIANVTGAVSTDIQWGAHLIQQIQPWGIV